MNPGKSTSAALMMAMMRYMISVLGDLSVIYWAGLSNCAAQSLELQKFDLS